MSSFPFQPILKVLVASASTRTLTVTPKGVIKAKPEATVTTYAISGMEAFPDVEKFSFMKTVFFFSSPEAASKWVSENPGPVVLSLDEG